MIALLIVLYLTTELSKELSSLPTPVNLTVDSKNFHHVLFWDPGPGTPRDTHYIVFHRVSGWKKKKQTCIHTNTTSCKLKLKENKSYDLSVQASHDQSLSPESTAVSFTPFRDTKIQAPTVSLSRCANCLKVNISLPKADKSSEVGDILEYYGAFFRIFWKKAKEKEPVFQDTFNGLFTLDNLETEMEYCVQVQTMIRVNKNTSPSSWMCAFTSALELSKVPAVVGAVATTLVIVGVAIVGIIMSLVYTGFLCKLKTHMPSTLLISLFHGHILNLERTIPDSLSMTPEPEDQRRIPAYKSTPTSTEGPTSKREDDDDDEEEEDEEECREILYWDRPTMFSSDTSSFRDKSGLSTLAVPEVSESSSVGLLHEVEQLVIAASLLSKECNQAETKGEREKISFMPNEDEPVCGDLDEDEQGIELMEEDNSGNVNLLSLTLGSTWGESKVLEQEEQSTKSSMSEFYKPPEQQSLLFTSLQGTLSSTEEQNELQPDNQTLLASMRGNGYESRPQEIADTFPGYLVACTVDTQPEQSEEEEEEEFPGYIGR